MVKENKRLSPFRLDISNDMSVRFQSRGSLWLNFNCVNKNMKNLVYLLRSDQE
jgi:hypothetical protein